jgi:hydrogenase maturation factor HypF (carbamoyltransferase family)
MLGSEKNHKVHMYLIILTGRLHGVGFRYAVSHYANVHHLVGTVRNIPEGVEIIINDKDFLNNFDSPLMSRVDTQTIEESNVVGVKYKDFKIVRSEY